MAAKTLHEDDEKLQEIVAGIYSRRFLAVLGISDCCQRKAWLATTRSANPTLRQGHVYYFRENGIKIIPQGIDVIIRRTSGSCHGNNPFVMTARQGEAK